MTQTVDITQVVAYDLTAEDAAVIMSLSRRLADEFSSPQDPSLFEELEVISGEVPKGVRRAAVRARLTEGTGALVLRGLSVIDTQLGQTPSGWRDADTDGTRIHAFQTLLLGSLLGDCIGWDAQQDGRIVTDIVPSPAMEESLVSSSSSRELTWHTEDAFSPYRADWVGLLCLRNPARVPTTITTVGLHGIPDDIRQVLSEPRFIVLPDSAHEMAPSATHAIPVPVLSSADSGSVLRVDRDFMSAVPGDDAALRALTWLTAELDANLTDLLLEPGDSAFINNKVVAHGRRAFVADFQSNERWLKRVNVVRDLRLSRPLRASGTSRSVMAS
jgi:Fe(II)/alpha-ketoglutarate-dependent arginine beta-hydroxylase